MYPAVADFDIRWRPLRYMAMYMSMHVIFYFRIFHYEVITVITVHLIYTSDQTARQL